MIELFKAAEQLINHARHIALSAHINPDLDGLGSLLALTEVLREMKRNPLAFSTSAMPEFFKSLPAQKVVNNLDPAKIDLIIGLDYGSPERLEILTAYPQIKADFLSFDHHAVGQHLGLKIVDANASSTAEIIYNFINFLKRPINGFVATCLLAGIMEDTGQFRHANTSAQALKITGELMLKGASLQKISRAVYSLNPDKKLSALTEILDKIETSARAPLVFVVIDYETFGRAADGFGDLDIAEILSSSPEAKIALTITEKTPGWFDISLRAQPDRGVDVSRLAVALGGGGHRLAAGFHTDKKPREIITEIEKLFLATAELNN